MTALKESQKNMILVRSSGSGSVIFLYKFIVITVVRSGMVQYELPVLSLDMWFSMFSVSSSLYNEEMT